MTFNTCSSTKGLFIFLDTSRCSLDHQEVFAERPQVEEEYRDSIALTEMMHLLRALPARTS